MKVQDYGTFELPPMYMDLPYYLTDSNYIFSMSNAKNVFLDVLIYVSESKLHFLKKKMFRIFFIYFAGRVYKFYRVNYPQTQIVHHCKH